MYADKLTLCNFKNIETAEISFSKNINIFCGNNAQGKTNLIEALYLFSAGRSFRVPKDKNLILFSKENGWACLDFNSRGRNYHNQIKLYHDRKKEILINGLQIRQQSELSGLFCSVIFTPEHLDLVKDGPAQRRKFIDMAICQLRPKYSAAIYEYQKILIQKNMLLKDIYRNPQLRDTLEIWNEKLAGVGAYIALMRNSYLIKLGQRAANYQTDISRGKEKLVISYLGFSPDLPTEMVEIKNLLYQKLVEAEQEEIQNGAGIIGVHRDDIEICINDNSARFYASQGQQRSCVLALKLAEGDAVFEETGEEPVYLLDDILSELDSDRQEYITKKIQGKQVFITCCEPHKFADFGEGKTFYVENGKINET